MNVCLRTSLVALLVVSSAAPAAAQEKGQVGVSLGFPGSVGFVWHVTDRFALKPDVTFRFTSFETSTTQTVTVGNQTQTIGNQLESDSSALGVSLSGLLYISKRDAVSMFVAPQYAYSRNALRSSTSIATVTPGSLGSVPPRESTAANHAAAGLFGVQYAPSRRFSVIGQAGLAYSTSSDGPLSNVSTFVPGTFSSTSTTRTTSHSLGIQAAVGIVLYFR